MDSTPADLTAILASVWDELDAATRDRSHGFHLPALATLGLDGAPTARTVVLRRALRESAELHCHTDVRSAKVAEIAARKRVSWMFYDAGRKLQVRVESEAEVLREGDIVDAAWSRSTLSARRCYLAPHAPGEVLAAWSPNLPEALLGRVPSPSEAEAGRANFAVVRAVVASIDWLFLASDGHRRARFVADGVVPKWMAHWMAP